MAKDMEGFVGTTSLYYSVFQNMFELVDATSAFWQPTLKAVGRTQLELATLQARQSQAFVHWAHQLTRPATLSDFFNANAQFWIAITQDYLETAPRVSAAVETAAQAVAPKVLELPSKPARDTLILLEREDEATRERKVA